MPEDNPNQQELLTPEDWRGLERLPSTYNEIETFFLKKHRGANIFSLRKLAMERIEVITERPIISFTMQTNINEAEAQALCSINDSDVHGIRDLLRCFEGDNVDVFIISNGGSITSAVRLVELIREKCNSVRVLLSAEAYSAATLISFSADVIIMTAGSTLGPIDPQVYGIPAREFLDAIDRLEKKAREHGQQAIAPYVPLIARSPRGLELVELARNSIELSKHYAKEWLSHYNMNAVDKDRIEETISAFIDREKILTHALPINRNKGRELGLNISRAEDIYQESNFDELLISLSNQYHFFYANTPFVKSFEDPRQTSWGRQFNREL
jgi:hypothetical protein